MTGIVAALTGTTGPNVLWTAGLYRTGSSAGADTSPINTSGNSASGAVSYNYTWVGYYRPNVTGSVTLGLQCPYQEYINGIPSAWGGGGSSVGYLWFGQVAISGYNSGNYTIYANDTNGSSTLSVISGIYYPIRITWSTSLPYSYDPGGIFEDPTTYSAQSSITFTSAGSSSVSGLIWYNGRTNGF